MVDTLEAAKDLFFSARGQRNKSGTQFTDNWKKSYTGDSTLRLLNAVKETRDVDASFSLIEEQYTKLKKGIEEYWSFLKNIPTVCVLLFCVEKSKTNSPGHNYLYLRGIKRLWESGLLPIATQGLHRVLGDFHSDEHLSIVENIRCMKEWGLLEREELVNLYIQLSYDLERFTFGMIHVAFDPDRLKVERKTIKYEFFMDFVQKLSERDALIAKLLYFGAPNIESVVSLKITALDMEELEIKFEGRSIRFPKHLMNDIAAYIQSRKDNPDDLVFVNVRGEQVERVHLNQAFTRKSSKIPGGFKITPATLLKTI